MWPGLFGEHHTGGHVGACPRLVGFVGDAGLQAFPPREKWDDWREYDVKQWPRRVEKRYMLVPTICFNCEAACGMLAWIDKDTMRIRKFD